MNYEIKIPDGAKFLIKTLQKSGFSAYVVGGCVRDSIMGREPNDWDICTSAVPEQTLEVFRDKKVIETGLKHGTVTVIIEKIPYEITTYRIDGDYKDNRRPDSVTFTDNLTEDLRRRDFTVNAMAYNDDLGLVDPFCGVQDIKNKIIRCVGSAHERFNEDALRIMRAIRFSSQLEFVIDPETNREIHQLCGNLKNISSERINSEFCKIVSSDVFCKQLVLYSDIFSLFIPELQDMIRFPQNNPWHIYDVFEHTVHAVEKCPSRDLITRLAVLFHDFGKPHSWQDGEDGTRHFYEHGKVSAEMTNKIMRRLKFDNDTKQNVVQLVKYHDVLFNPEKKYVKKWLNKIGEEQFRRLIDVKEADNRGQNPELAEERVKNLNEIRSVIDEILKEKECFSLKNLAVRGQDLINIGYKPGKELGDVLKSLLSSVMDEKVDNNKEELINLAKHLKKNDF